MRTRGGGSDPQNDTATVELELTNNISTGWGSNSYAYVKVLYNDEETTYTGSTSLSVTKGKEITIEVYEFDDGWSKIFLNEIRAVFDEREYSLGVGIYEDRQYETISEYTFKVNDDMKISLTFSNRVKVNPVEIVNDSDETIHLLGGLSVAPNTTMTISGVGTTDCWFMVMFDADRQIPLIDFDSENVSGDSTRDFDIDDQHLEFVLFNSNHVRIDIIDPDELVTSDRRTIQVGESVDMELNDRLDLMYEKGVAHIDPESEDEGIATVTVSGIYGHQAISVRGVSSSDSTCTITFTLHYDLSESDTEFSTSMEITVVDVPHSITINCIGNGKVTASASSATQGQIITLTVTAGNGHRLKDISVQPAIEIIENGDTCTFSMPDDDVIVIATFVPMTHTVVFHNGETVHWTANIDYGDTLVFPDTEPVRESDEEYDYKFTGWADGSGTPVSEETVVTDDLDLYAHYSSLQRLYDVCFIADGIVYEHQELAFGAVIVAPVQDPYIEGYEFICWSGYEEGMTVAGDVSFHAVFEEVEEPTPSWGIPDDDDVWVPPTIVYEDSGDDDLWIFVVLGSVALFLFLLFARYERRG